MRIPGAPGRFTGGGGSDDDETDSTPDSGLGGSIPGAPSGGSDPEPAPDPDPAPEPEPEPDPDPSGFRDELGGDPVDSGGRNTGGSTRPDPAPDPSPTTRASASVDVPAGASDGGGIGERVTSNLDSLSQAYTDTIAEPAGDLAAAANPVAGIETEQLGTNRVGTVTESAVENVAQLGNVPGAVAGTIDAGQALAAASARSRDQVTIGGVPTGVSVPNPEGQRQNAQAAAGIAASSAAQAAENPFETTGRVIGGAVGGALGGAAIARGARGVSRAADAPDAPDTPDGTVPSGRSNPGTEGIGSLLEEVDVDARRGTSGPSTRSRLEGEVSRAVDDVTERVENSPLGDFLGDERAQLQRERPDTRDTGSPPDRTRPADAGGSFEDVRQDALTEAQDQLRSDATRPNPGTFDGGPSPFREGRGDTIDPDGGVSLQRGAGVVDDVDAAAGSSTAGSGLGTGTGTGLGSISSAADPSGIADTGTAAGARLDPAQILGAGTDSTGAGAQSEVLDELGAGRLGGGTLPGDATGTGTDTDSGTDTFAPTDTGTGTDSGPGTDTPTDTATSTADLLGTTTLSGTTADTDTTGTGAGLPGSPTLGEPVASSETVSRLAPRDGDGGGRPVRPRGEEEADQSDDDAPVLAFDVAADELDSGIASAEEILR